MEDKYKEGKEKGREEGKEELRKVNMQKGKRRRRM